MSSLSTNLIINGVKLGEQYAINKPGIVHVTVIRQGLVKLGQLIHGLVSY